MDILASAGPFVIAAVSDAATAIISVNPAGGTFEGNVMVPAMPSRVGDFSDTEFQPIDYATCSGDKCIPFPNAIIPASRISPYEIMALRQVPLPDVTVPHSSSGTLNVRGSVRPGAPFVIDGQSNPSLSVFAGYLAIPPPPRSGTTPLKLYIDGNLVASTDVAYRTSVF
jgi:hypothetical protein